MRTSVAILLPEPRIGKDAAPPAEDGWSVLYLLHGHSDDHLAWLYRTSIARYAEPYNLMVVMPNVHRSFYTDMKHGHPYWSFVAEELPQVVASIFPVATDRAHTFAAGLSMGGYGAFRLGLGLPQRFAAVGSFSGALDVAASYKASAERSALFDAIYGSYAELQGSDRDLFALAERRAQQSADLPRLYQDCGTEDFLYAANQRFRDHLVNLGLPNHYSERPGVHDWQFWDESIQRFLTFALGAPQ